MPDLAIIVPTRGRPDNVRKVIAAWDFTNTWADADLVLVVDADDPMAPGYWQIDAEREAGLQNGPVKIIEVPKWLPMVHKLDAAARELAGQYWAIGFAGDDHLPQTIGWAARYLTVLRELGTGMVYGDDGYQGRKLSTEWAVTSDVVRALGRMVPAPVDHMYCDNAMMDLFGAAGALRHLPEVRIEHMHPVAGKAETDEQYQRVNHRDQFSKDRRVYQGWKDTRMGSDVITVRALRQGRPDEAAPQPLSRRNPGSGPRRADFPRKGSAVGRNFPFPRHFKKITGATPDVIGLTLADFASAVPADQEIVELGVYQGRTALMMAWGARQGHGAHLTAVDAWDLEGNTYGPPFNTDGSRRWAAHWVQSLGYSRSILLVQGFATDVAERWVTTPDLIGYGNKPIGLLFVDDDHSYEGARAAIESWAPHLAPDARIAVDDYGHPDWPGVKQAVDKLVEEGFLTDVAVFHDRLAVTSLVPWEDRPAPAAGRTAPAAITSEGVSPSPYPAVDDQVAVTVDLGAPSVIVPEPVFEPDADGFTDGSRAGSPHESGDPDQVDREVSTEDWAWKVTPGEAIAVNVPLGPVADLNLVGLKALAKHRGIVLGARKDKRDLILQALREGK